MKKEVVILLVEDNPADAELCIRALKKSNLANNLVWAKDGAEALDFIFATGAHSARSVVNGPSVILLDLRLPKVDGIEVLRRVKGDVRTKAIPVVVMTSSKEECDKADSLLLGVNSYISKPVEFDEFTRTVSKLGLYWLLQRQQQHQQAGGG